MAEMTRSPLHPLLEKQGATFTELGDCVVPAFFTDPVDEHRAVREAAGLLHLGHVMALRVAGRDAGAFLDYAFVSTLSDLPVGGGGKTLMVNGSGAILADPLICRTSATDFLVICVSSTVFAVFDRLRYRMPGFDVTLSDLSATDNLIKLHGPASPRLLSSLASGEQASQILGLVEHGCARVQIADADVVVIYTTITGEDGYALLVPNAQLAHLWRSLLTAGAEHGIRPIGIDALNTLRLEAGTWIFGYDISSNLTPVDVGFADQIRAKKSDFVGKDALLCADCCSVLIALRGGAPVSAPSVCEVYYGGRHIGQTTSLLNSPTLGHPIALARVDAGTVRAGDSVDLLVHDEFFSFTIVDQPFYTRGQAGSVSARA